MCNHTRRLRPYPPPPISTGTRSREERHSDLPERAGAEIREITLPQQKIPVRRGGKKKVIIKERGVLLNHQTAGSLVNTTAVNSWGAQGTFFLRKPP